MSLRESLLRLVARVSSRAFLGEEICRNDNWLRVTREYTVDGIRAAEELRLWPAPLRALVHWFIPSCQRARADVAEARRIVSGVLEKRRLEKQRGEKVDYEDALEWYVVCSSPLLQLLLRLQDMMTGLNARLGEGSMTRPSRNLPYLSPPSTPRRSLSTRS